MSRKHPLFDKTSRYRLATRLSMWKDGGKACIQAYFDEIHERRRREGVGSSEDWGHGPEIGERLDAALLRLPSSPSKAWEAPIPKPGVVVFDLAGASPTIRDQGKGLDRKPLHYFGAPGPEPTTEAHLNYVGIQQAGAGGKSALLVKRVFAKAEALSADNGREAAFVLFPFWLLEEWDGLSKANTLFPAPTEEAMLALVADLLSPEGLQPPYGATRETLLASNTRSLFLAQAPILSGKVADGVFRCETTVRSDLTEFPDGTVLAVCLG